jgi:hypothetical protein
VSSLTVPNSINRLCRALITLSLGWALILAVFEIALEIAVAQPGLPPSAAERALWSLCLAISAHRVDVHVALTVGAFAAGFVAWRYGVQSLKSPWVPTFCLFTIVKVGCGIAAARGGKVPSWWWLTAAICGRTALIGIFATAGPKLPITDEREGRGTYASLG